MNQLSGISIVLPSLNPDVKLLRTISGLLEEGFEHIILVNDGSGPESAQYFQSAAALPQVQLLRHETNLGKGAALKTAFRWFLENRPDAAGVITVDGDGQHTPSDTRACALEMLSTGKLILGCRDFKESLVPKRSRFGNRITCGVFRLLCGMKLSDTQTGLRAIPTDAVRQFVTVKGERFEYETNMLLEMKARNIPYAEVKISTVYIEENSSSHFRAVRDSVRIYRLILAHFIRYTLSSMLSAILDTGLFALFCWLFASDDSIAKQLLPFLIARGISSLFNFTLNKKLVFNSKGSTGKALLRYYALAVPVFLLQIGLTQGAYHLLHIRSGQVFLKTLIYTIVMACLYLISFMTQQRWVFARSKEKEE
ncbi:MAG: bifunctional glycosyltransferase family 2/GtrA family protein [Oscillospiraceae bacterium]|nr:bifunctional glycosyltransferase family 2/GtrA family protein [Oscillospiraceae bacterium]